jgi:hypothetical protein
MMITHEDIAKRAREIWEKEGRPEGRDMEHWLQAETDLHRQQGRHDRSLAEQPERVATLKAADAKNGGDKPKRSANKRNKSR